jgi:chemotaxis protein CheC
LQTNYSAARFDLPGWTKLAKIGSTTAISGLSQMVNQDFKVTALNIEEVSLRSSINLIGKPEDRVVGVYLQFSGYTSGQMLLVFDPQTAYQMVDMALGVEPGSTTILGEMERLVLGEMGNNVGTFFLNRVADFVGTRLKPSSPVVVEDLAGAVIGSVLAEAFYVNDALFVIKLLFGSITREIEGRFLVLPSLGQKNNDTSSWMC